MPLSIENKNILAECFNLLSELEKLVLLNYPYDNNPLHAFLQIEKSWLEDFAEYALDEDLESLLETKRGIEYQIAKLTDNAQTVLFFTTGRDTTGDDSDSSSYSTPNDQITALLMDCNTILTELDIIGLIDNEHTPYSFIEFRESLRRDLKHYDQLGCSFDLDKITFIKATAESRLLAAKTYFKTANKTIISQEKQNAALNIFRRLLAKIKTLAPQETKPLLKRLAVAEHMAKTFDSLSARSHELQQQLVKYESDLYAYISNQRNSCIFAYAALHQRKIRLARASIVDCNTRLAKISGELVAPTLVMYDFLKKQSEKPTHVEEYKSNTNLAITPTLAA